MALEVTKPEPQVAAAHLEAKTGGKKRSRGPQSAKCGISQGFFSEPGFRVTSTRVRGKFSHDPHFVLILQGLVSFLICQGITNLGLPFPKEGSGSLLIYL